LLVDAVDYTLWRDTIGQTGTAHPADGDASGIIDIVDYTVWQTNFGMSIPTALAASPVPEPSAVVLLLAMVTTALPRNRAYRTPLGG
jgi:hypothetical protein